MKQLIELFSVLIFAITWLAGIVLAKGFWMTLAAVCIPPYGWYLVVERLMQIHGWLP